MTIRPTDQDRLRELISKMDAATTDGDLGDLTQDDIGDIYSWLVWARDAAERGAAGGRNG